MLTKLFKYIRGYEKAAILAPILVIVEVICELIMPKLMSGIIDDGIQGDGGMRYILFAGLIMLVLAVFSMISGVGSAKFASEGSQGFGANLRKAMFDHVQEFSFADIDRFSSASLITRLTNDVNNIQMMVNMGLRMLVRAPVMLIFALFVCFRIHAKLTLILICVVPLMALAVGLLMRACHRLFQIFQEKIDGLNDTVQENLIAIRVVKAFVRADHERSKFKKANDGLKDAGVNVAMHMISVFPVMMIVLQLATLAVYWFGSGFIAEGTMLTGDLTAYIGYISQVLMSVFMVSNSLRMATRAIACGERVTEVLDTEADIVDGPATELPEQKGRIEFKNVSFKYRSGTGDDVLHDISFTVEPGQFVAIMGGTGTGKSSLVNLIPRFYDVTDGAILVDGMDVRDYPVKALRERIGMVLQNNLLFSGTIRENLLWGKADATEEEMIQAARDAQAEEFILKQPDGYDTFLEQGGVNVSGGQKQRLCIARAMLRHPSILILDDSTSAVDTVTEAAIRESFHKNLKDTSVLIIAQRISSVMSADKIIIIDDDHIVAEGNHEELLKTSPIYQEIYQSQQEGVISNG